MWISNFGMNVQTFVFVGSFIWIYRWIYVECPLQELYRGIKKYNHSKTLLKILEMEAEERKTVPMGCYKIINNLYIGGQKHFDYRSTKDKNFFGARIAVNKDAYFALAYEQGLDKDKNNNYPYLMYNYSITILHEKSQPPIKIISPIVLEVADQIKELLDNNVKVLVYCDNGNSRSNWAISTYIAKYYLPHIQKSDMEHYYYTEFSKLPMDDAFENNISRISNILQNAKK